MKIFIGQAVTGENIPKIKKELVKVYATLEAKGHSCYDTLRDGPKELVERSKKERLEYALRRIDESDTFLAILRSERRSEGMLYEWNYASSKGKTLILAVKEDIETPLRNEADKVIEYGESSDLINKLGQL